MDSATKADLAEKLANQFGLSGKPIKEGSHYDATTGTLFIGSTVYKYEDMEQAKVFFEENKARAEKLGDASCKYFEIAQIALEHLMQDTAGIGGRLVVKEGA